MDEITKIDLQALKAEILSWQTLRFNLIGVAATADAAFLGWMATAGNKVSLSEALIPVLLLMCFSVVATIHAARMVIRIATYLVVFYDSPWEGRLNRYRANVKPWDVNRLIAALYASLAIASLLVARTTSHATLSVAPSDSNGFAWLLGICLLLALLVLALVGRARDGYIRAWNQVKTQTDREPLPH